MEVHWNTHREWWRGVLVFRYRSKVCKKLKAITPFCFAVRHEIPMTSHERSTFRERLSEPTTVQPLGGLVVVGGGCFVASRFDGLLLIYYLEKSSHRATISREPLWLRPSGRAMKPITVHFRHFSIPPRPARFRRFLEAALGPGRWSGPRRHPRHGPLTRGPRVAEAKAPFPNAVGRKLPLGQSGAASPAPFIEDDLRPTDVRERPGALVAASAHDRVVALPRGSPVRPAGPSYQAPLDRFVGCLPSTSSR